MDNHRCANIEYGGLQEKNDAGIRGIINILLSYYVYADFCSLEKKPMSNRTDEASNIINITVSALS